MAYTYARKKSSLRHWPRLMALGVVCFPLSLSRVDFRSNFTVGLSISTNHNSPAFAALEDLHADLRPDANDLSEIDLPLLGAPTRAVPIEEPRMRHVALEGAVVRQPQPASTLPSKNEVASPVLAADDLYSDPENEPSLGRVAEKLVREELANAAPERVIASTLGTKIIVRGTTVAHAPRAARASASTPFKPEFVNLSKSPRPDRAMWLDGRLEMTGGLAFTGDDVRMSVKRTLDGRSLERGQIWVTEGRFEIKVDRPVGQLVAELRARDGRVIGRGEIDLLGVSELSSADQTRIGDLHIALRPATDVASVRAISAYSHRDHKIGLADARVELQSVNQALSVDDEGFATETELGRGSTFLARAEAKGYRPSLAIGHAEQTRDVRLLSNKMVRALVELERKPGDRERADLSSIVWGSVEENGKAVADARVEITAGLEPIYFNELYLPDRNLNQTSTNGLFAFLDVPPGVQAVRVARGERHYPAQVFATEDQHVSVVDFHLRDDRAARFRVTDVFDHAAPIAAELKLVGTDARADGSGDDAIRFASSGGTMMVEADAGAEFETSRVSVPSERAEVNVPLVRRAWLEALRARHPEARDRGTVLGFVDEQDFEVGMTGSVLNEKLIVVYFDAAGHVLERSSGVAGGGFAILNAPPGLQTVRITPLGSRESFAQVVVAEPNLVHVLTWAPPAR